MRSFAALTGAILVLTAGHLRGNEPPRELQTSQRTTPPGVVQSPNDPRFMTVEDTDVVLASLPHYPFEMDEAAIQAIKNRPLPPGANGAKVIQATPTRFGAGSIAAAPPLGTNFEAFSMSNFVPPDPIMAAGPNHLILAVNLSWGVWSKSGEPRFFISFQSWFAPVNTLNLGYSDPKVMYDPYAGRWILMCIGYGSPPPPRGGFFLFLFAP